MKKPTNKFYYVAVNHTDDPDEMYPLKEESHETDDGVLTPEVIKGYITSAYVIPDGQVIPEEFHPTPKSLYILQLRWGDLSTLTWQQTHDTYLW